jgi:hypothetical protein
MRATVEAYTALLARAFDGAITVDGTRIVAHPSGMLCVRDDRRYEQPRTPPRSLDKDNDWSGV